MKYRIDNNQIFFNDIKKPVPARIVKVVESDNRLFILFSSWNELDTVMPEQNICCLDLDGNQIWRIHKVDFAKYGPSVFTGIRIADDGTLLAHLPIGLECTIDKDSGELIDAVFVK